MTESQYFHQRRESSSGSPRRSISPPRRNSTSALSHSSSRKAHPNDAETVSVPHLSFEESAHALKRSLAAVASEVVEKENALATVNRKIREINAILKQQAVIETQRQHEEDEKNMRSVLPQQESSHDATHKRSSVHAHSRTSLHARGSISPHRRLSALHGSAGAAHDKIRRGSHVSSHHS